METKEILKRTKKIEEKAITLIALVITIVVLLILAAVSINAVLGDNGIFRTADEGKIEYRKGEILDLLNTAEANVSLKASGKPNLEEYIQYIQDEAIVIKAEKEDDGSYLVTTADGYVFSISIVEGTSVNDIVIEYEGQAGNLTLVVRVSKVTKDSITVIVTGVDGANNISYGIRKVGEESYNVLLPTSTQTSYEFTDLEEETAYEIEVRVTIKEEERVLTTKETTEKEKLAVPTQWDTSKVTPELSKDDTQVYVPVPKGFTASTIEKEQKVEEGFVIKQNETNNEYVWIPVDETSLIAMYTERTATLTGSGGVTTSIYSKLIGGAVGSPPNSTGFREPDLVVGSRGSSYDARSNYQEIVGASSPKDFAQKMVDEYKEIHDSIEQYGGFYIGRYELTGEITNPTVAKGGTVITEQNWYHLKAACMSLVDNSEKQENEITAKTTMIYGNQWDEVCNWLETKDYNIDDSSSWGNYSNYNETVTEDKQEEKAGEKTTAGYSENWKANNIYDLAGNCFEWTQEANRVEYRVSRGGNYLSFGFNTPASLRYNYIPDKDDHALISTRPTLYISRNG